MLKQPASHLRRLVKGTHALRDRLHAEISHGRDPSLREAHASLAAALHRALSADETADILAQAVTCAAPILNSSAAQHSRALPWLLAQLAPWERFAIELAPLSLSPPLLVSLSPAAHLYDAFLHHYHKGHRKRRGVFFTPEPIADYIVAETDRLLRDDFGLPGGLAHSPLGNSQSAICNSQFAIPFLLDPAAGTGVFLLAALRHIHRTLTDRWQKEGQSAAEILRRWNAFVPTLLPRLYGIEILPAPALLAKLNIALKLADTGYEFKEPGQINILLADALSPATQSASCNLQSAIPIVLGNPPFSSLSTNTNDWIARLVRGDDEVRGYIRANGQKLNERKTWLHDDYVKFIRLAQWYVEEAGTGIVGFVTNHGYLDNATFRLMRQELLRVFPHIRLVDLHGNRKKHEISPDGSPDENIFGLDQGVAISLFSRPPKPTRSVSEGIHLGHSDLWGSRAAKLQALNGQNPSLALRASFLTPAAPDWRFLPTAARGNHPEYDRAWSLADAMPLNATAPVTARDKFVVAFTKEELCQRIEAFRDLSIPNDEIRRRYFTRTRSARHQPGDTRGWKLTEARRIVAADENWQRHILRCLYRPFDWRYIFWHPAMIDWPREEVTRHLITGSKFKVQSSRSSTLNLEHGTLNYCLIARRQQLPGHPCTFFWMADGLALDGVIRSDNRGSESLFPLYLHDDGGPRANFAAEFVAHAEEMTLLAWLPHGRGDLTKSLGPEDLFGYIYALFHATSYRERYADSLRTAFPRVLIPQNRELFQSMSQLGLFLTALHVQDSGSVGSAASTQYSVLGTQYSSSNPALPADEIYAFRVGGYPVLKKWLQPPHRTVADVEYQRIMAAIRRTIAVTQEIDAALAAHGGLTNCC